MLVPFPFFFFKRVFPRWQTKLNHFSIEILLGERIFLAPGGEGKWTKKEKKTVRLCWCCSYQKCPISFFPFLRVSKGKETPNFFRLGISLWWHRMGRRKVRYILFAILFSSFFDPILLVEMQVLTREKRETEGLYKLDKLIMWYHSISSTRFSLSFTEEKCAHNRPGKDLFEQQLLCSF